MNGVRRPQNQNNIVFSWSWPAVGGWEAKWTPELTEAFINLIKTLISTLRLRESEIGEMGEWDIDDPGAHEPCSFLRFRIPLLHFIYFHCAF